MENLMKKDLIVEICHKCTETGEKGGKHNWHIKKRNFGHVIEESAIGEGKQGHGKEEYNGKQCKKLSQHIWQTSVINLGTYKSQRFLMLS